MDILVFIANLDGAGAQRTTVNLVNAWADDNHNVNLVIGSKNIEYPSYIKLIRNNVDVLILNKSKSIYCLSSLISILYTKKLDIVFSPSPESSAVLMLAKFFSFNKCSAIVRESNYRSYNKNRLSIRFFFYKYAYRSADAVVALSNGVKKDLINRFNLCGKNIKVIYNPVDITFIEKQASDKTYLIERLKNNQVVNLIAVGRLVRQKGFDILINAMARLHDSNIHLSIFGEGPERENLESLIVKKNLQGRVFLEGYTKNPYVNMHHSDIFILSSRWEGFGHVIVESMACGLPVISFDCNSGPNEIINDGVNGVLCHEELTSCLVKEILKLSYDVERRDILKNNAYKTIKNYNKDVISSQYINLFMRTQYQ